MSHISSKSNTKVVFIGKQKMFKNYLLEQNQFSLGSIYLGSKRLRCNLSLITYMVPSFFRSFRIFQVGAANFV
jgi:hypothetical protein